MLPWAFLTSLVTLPPVRGARVHCVDMLRAPRSKSGIPRGHQALAPSSARERSSSEPELPGPIAEATNPHVLQSARRHMPRGTRPRNVGRSTAPPARPFPRRGVGREPLAEPVRRTTPCGVGTTEHAQHPRQQAESSASLRRRVPVRPFHMETRPRGPPHGRFAEAVDRRPAGRRAGGHDVAPTPTQFLARWARGPPRQARSAAVPWYRSPGGSARLRRARRREASCQDPKTPTSEPDCRIMRSETWC